MRAARGRRVDSRTGDASSGLKRELVRADIADVTPPSAPPPPPPSLVARVPAHEVMTELLRLHGERRPRSPFARVLGLAPLTREEASWYAGALGEIAVARVLEDLPRGWHVLHSVPVGRGGADIDHVVIGPGGVFTINTKRHAGQHVWVAGRKLMVAGEWQQHIRNAESEAKRAKRRLTRALGREVPVGSLVVVVDARQLTVRRPHERVTVLRASQLDRWLRHQPIRLAPFELEQVLRAATHPMVWHDDPAAPADSGALQRGFAALDGEVRRARAIRAGWTVAAACAALSLSAELVDSMTSEVVRAITSVAGG